MQTLIKNSTLVTASETFVADLLLADGRIALIGRDLPAGGAHVVDGTGLFTLPGAIDVHTHLELPFGGTTSSDDFYSGHKAAAFGGTTFHIDFAMQAKGERLRDAVDRWNKKAADKAVLDYGYHLGITDLNDAVLAEIPVMGKAGLPSLKLFMAYKGNLQVDDTTLFKTMLTAAEHGLLVMVHAENGDAIDVLVKQALAAGHTSAEWHALTRPDWCEGEATQRAVALAAVAGAPLYVVHVTCAKAAAAIAAGRAQGVKVMGETCVQYFHFSVDNLRQADGSKFVCSPPVRTAADQAALWEAVRTGALQHISTDHCPFLFDGTRPIMYEGQPFQLPGKELGAGDFSKIPNGLPVIGDRMPILWSYGVGKGHLSLNQLVALACTNPAKIFGLYPQKGTLAVGADADVVIWDPHKQATWGVAAAHQRTDYNLFEGWPVTGLPVKVYRRGELLAERTEGGDLWHGRAGTGKWTPRATHAPVL
ncbi:MAG: dihydropyrimidinase [Anaerolineales bacterium]|nr:dihydropyrimidinase [Anaerolineales bacterium]